MNITSKRIIASLIVMVLLQSCNLPVPIPSQVVASPIPATVEPPTAQPPTEEPLPVVQHVTFPASTSVSTLFFDADSFDTAHEKRAPYGDSYDINRLERPFLQDMSYVHDLDIKNFSMNKDADWFYISMKLVGTDPNNTLGIDYGVEFDTNLDGFGDVIVIASPPFSTEWMTDTVRVYADKNHNTSGASSARSDAPYPADGYESLLFDGGQISNEDPDLAWVRINADTNATVQFAIKRSVVGTIFMFGVLADAGMKDVTKLDYVDRFTEEEAGSPVKDKKYYPLKALYAVDNTCREAFGFDPTGFEPMLCPREIPPTPKPGQPQPDQPQAGCTDPGSYGDQGSCEAAGCVWVVPFNTILYTPPYCTSP